MSQFNGRYLVTTNIFCYLLRIHLLQLVLSIIVVSASGPEDFSEWDDELPWENYQRMSSLGNSTAKLLPCAAPDAGQQAAVLTSPKRPTVVTSAALGLPANHRNVFR